MVERKLLDKFFKLHSITGLTASSGSRIFAVVSSETFKEKGGNFNTSLQVYETETGKKILEIAGEGKHLSLPAISHDGKRIAYQYKNGDETGITFRNIIQDSREIPENISLGAAVHGIQFTSAGDILFSMEESEDPVLKKRKKEGYDHYFYDEESRYTSLYLYRPGTGVRRITEGVQVWDFHESEGSVAFIGSSGNTESDWYGARIFSLRINDGKISMIHDPEWRELASPRISPDGDIAFLESICSDRGLSSGDIFLVDHANGKISNITDHLNRSFTDIRFTENALMALWTQEHTCGISLYSKGWKDIWAHEGTAMPSFSPSFYPNSGGFLLQLTDDVLVHEVYLATGKNGIKKITAINDAVAEYSPYRSELVKWKSSDGMQIFGYLTLKSKDAPLIVNVHGGPTSSYYPAFLDRNTPLLDGGFSVFMPNYRGSVGKGRDYTEANIGDMGGMDLQDILTGISYLKSAGKVKTDSIFITGGSYGGFMTMWAITQTDIFKAGVALFGISDWVSFHGTTNISAWDAVHYRDNPYGKNLFEKFSPLNYIDRVKTPLLIMQGKEDPCVPASQAFQMFRAMKDMGKECRLIVFPREGHGFQEKNHQETELEEKLEFFRKFL
ncbi:MAG: S9 family peptidase [Candidatus Thermoplasmatota archaeon]|nr:S9 family peptidase [Candidatus Thermoplasmatota archaeon]